MARKTEAPRSSLPLSTSQLFRYSIVRALLDAAESLCGSTESPVSRRRLVNFLRGSQAPGAFDKPGLEDLYGLLESVSASWLHDIVDGLVEHGTFVIQPGKNGAHGLQVDAAERKRLESDSPALAGLFPIRPKLGANPEVEERLRSLRAELARKEGRAPYGIFPNATLAELAAIRPRTLAELSQLPGLGEARVRKYGRKLLQVILEK